MSMTVPGSYAHPSASAPREAPIAARGIAVQLRRLFGGPLTGIATVVLAGTGLILAYNIIMWGIVDAVWYAPGDGAACRDATGACWAVVAEKYRVMLFGSYPYAEHWRGALIVGVWIVWAVLSASALVPSRAKLAGWLVLFIASIIMMKGGIFGLLPVSTDLWGGLPLTFLIFGGTVAGGLPLAILLALGRRSQLPAIRWLSILTIDVVRGIPLLVVLFFAALILPLFTPEWLNFDKLIRAEVGMIIFFAAYAAEVVRGGLQAVSGGQDEAAQALGIGYWLRMRKVVLPQAMAISTPALFNDIIRAFKNTTFFSILGLFDVLGATKTALQDPNWVRYGMEGYIFVFALYFVICSALAAYGRGIERQANARKRRAER